jgi:arginyl-tRNA synthetase
LFTLQQDLMNIFEAFEVKLRAALARLVAANRLPEGLDLSRCIMEPPRDVTHGDLASNAAMVLAKPAKTNPRALAELIAAEMADDADLEKIEVAGAGFINFTLKPHAFHAVLRAVLIEGADFGRGAAKSVPVNIEYVSANPTGPMHVGHGRGAVFGDALAGLLDFGGFQVTREYYINDAGAQVDVLARSAFLRYCEALGDSVTIPDGLYPGDYLKPLGVMLAARYGSTFREQPESLWLPTIRAAAIDAMMELIRTDLAMLHIHHDVFFSERSLSDPKHDVIAQSIADLRAKGHVYEGRLEPPKGQLPDDWEDREQTLFRTTAFGDDVDRPLLKSDGSYTYFASDIAYHRSKFERGFPVMIDVWGADHGGYVKRVQAAIEAVTGGQAIFDVKLCQLVRLMRNNEPVKMSKRAGDFITLRDVVDEVGCDAVRFMMLFRKNDAPLDFDLAKVVEQSKDNPVFYVQYAHARAVSAFKQASAAFPEVDFSAHRLKKADFSALKDEAEIDMIRRLAHYPRLIEAACVAHEPHRIAFYLYDLAATFHSLWNKGKDMPNLRFVNHEDEQLTQARLALVFAVRSILGSGLAILGVTAPHEMR